MATKATQPAVVSVVLETFAVASPDGATVIYQRGEIIDPTDPALTLWPDKFGPITYAHPITRRALHTAATTEVRAD